MIKTTMRFLNRSVWLVVFVSSHVHAASVKSPQECPAVFGTEVLWQNNAKTTQEYLIAVDRTEDQWVDVVHRNPQWNTIASYALSQFRLRTIQTENSGSDKLVLELLTPVAGCELGYYDIQEHRQLGAAVRIVKAESDLLLLDVKGRLHAWAKPGFNTAQLRSIWQSSFTMTTDMAKQVQAMPAPKAAATANTASAQRRAAARKKRASPVVR
jgi:hypothetical protein